MDHVVEGSDGKELDTNEGSSDVEPYVGMECESEEAAKVFYDAYATRLGFIMRVDAFRRSMRDGKVVWRRLVCNKEGFRKLRPRRSENRKPRAITREGCKAMIVVKKETSGKWVVTRFVKEHNHSLVAAPANGRRSVLLSQTPDEKDVKIRELTAELQRERKRCAAYQEQLAMILRDMEEHSNHLSRNIDDVVQSVREFEARRDFARRAEKRNHENDTTSKKMSKSPCMVLLSLETKPSPMNTANVREFALITSSSSAFE